MLCTKLKIMIIDGVSKRKPNNITLVFLSLNPKYPIKILNAGKTPIKIITTMLYAICSFMLFIPYLIN